jgi:pimeloyl-ACP methyl ester carboxylesterase
MTTSIVRCASGDIAVHQSGGSGLPLVLIHGNSASSRAFGRQLNSPLGDRRRLIAIDLPGHGQSADAASPAHYGIAPYGRMIAEVARQLGVDHGIFVGWSLGGHAVLEASADLPKAAGFCIFGTPPLPFPPLLTGAFLDHPAMRFTFAETITAAEAPAYVAASFKPGFADIPPSFVEDGLRTDGRARAQLINPEGEPFRDEVRIVATLARPLAVLHGADEQLVNLDYFKTLTMPTLWRGAVQIIDDAGHAPQWEQPERFNALLDAFAGELE